jgi:ketosteroid isomerase-like protein
MAFSGSYEDRLRIRELLETYAAAVTCRNTDDWAGCWAEESEWHMPDIGVTLRGKKEIVSSWQQMMEEFHGPQDDPWAFSFISIPRAIMVNGDTASVQSTSLEAFLDASGQTVQLLGEYRDEVVQLSGTWQFRSRNWKLMPLLDAKAFLSA